MSQVKPPVHYWTSNTHIIGDETVNLRFEELLQMSEEQITEWVRHLRERVLEVWDTHGTPPLSGKDESEMTEIFRQMSGTPGVTISMSKAKSGGTHHYEDELDGSKGNIIINDGSLGSCVNQFFPTMMKAQINYQTKVSDEGSFNGYAVYDLFANPRFEQRMQKGCRRHFRRDSFYRYSSSIPANSSIGLVAAETGKQWVQLFKRDFTKFGDYGYWLSRVEPSEDGETGSGYTQVDSSKFLWLSKAEIIELSHVGIFPREALVNLIPGVMEIQGLYGMDIQLEVINRLETQLNDDEQYHIRFYKKSTRLFPNGFTAFKIGYIQVAVNFPPMIAKYIYEKYTEHIKKQPVINIYDPSSGWGGRIAGAMTVKDDRHVHYIGTDPNTDNYLNELGQTRYEYLATFINDSLRSFDFVPHTFDVYTLGSEVIGKDKRFKKYKGKLDLVFTSPPYWNRESYSDDPTQSLHKFPFYPEWKEGFLRPTLETAVSFLRSDRFLLWNISDIKVGNDYVPLEEDSNKILKSLGMRFVGIEKMALASMPGANRVGQDGKPTAKNFMKVNSRWIKYEPIFVWKKD